MDRDFRPENQKKYDKVLATIRCLLAGLGINPGTIGDRAQDYVKKQRDIEGTKGTREHNSCLLSGDFTPLNSSTKVIVE